MQFIASILPYIQVALAVLLSIAILLQARGSSVGGAFGDSASSTFYTRRGAEKTLFQATVVLGILFVATAFLTLFI